MTGCAQVLCEKDRGFVLQSGDLLFQDMDSGPLCDAIERVTTGCRGARFSHVGIAMRGDDGNDLVIEAVSDGVCVTPLRVFLQRSLDANHQPKVVVGRLELSLRHLIPRALNEALALKGKPYDKAFEVGNDRYYCSELVHVAFFRANNNERVFALRPMTFRDPDSGTLLPAWRTYFSELGVPVPEGEPGINPGAISRSPALTIVHAYGIPDGWATREPEGRW